MLRESGVHAAVVQVVKDNYFHHLQGLGTKFLGSDGGASVFLGM